MTDRLPSREAAAKAYAEATGYYVEFHPGLHSASADKIREGVDAAIKAHLKTAVEEAEYTDLILAVAYSENPLKAATEVIGSMVAVLQMKHGNAAAAQVLSAFAAA